MKKCVAVPLVMILMISSFSFSASLKKDISVLLKERTIKDLSPESLILVFTVNISNSSERTYYLSGYNYRFVVNGIEYLRLATSLEKEISINAYEDTLVAIPIKITYKNLFQAVPGIEDFGSVACYLTGEMRFSEGRKDKGGLPLAFSGEFPIFRRLEIEFVLLRENTLTFAGADLNLDVAFKNRNRFELIVDRISFQLELGGRFVGEGEIGGDKNIEKLSQKVFSLPLLLNFFEVGKEVHAMLQQASTGCRISGEVVIQTIWDRLTIPFDERGTIKISRPSL